MSAREDVLGRVRRSIGEAQADRESDYARIPRNYRQTGTLNVAGRVALFVDRLREYNATAHHCELEQISAAIAHAVSIRQKRTILIPAAFPLEWLPADLQFVDGTRMSYEELDRSEGVLTACAVAIAETGTIVLQHSAGQGRRALTLIPDYLLCIVFEDQIVETVPEAIRAMKAFHHVPLTTISGPSATADIEMTRVKGVHGPRTLDVILVARTVS
jgi:L-lactate dehydrogenase complex protein LldG